VGALLLDTFLSNLFGGRKPCYHGYREFYTFTNNSKIQQVKVHLMSSIQRLRARHLRLITAALLVLLTSLSMPLAGASAQTPAGTVAYVLPNDEHGDEIHLIAPDGSNDHEIWRTDQPDPEHVQAIASLAWHPDATELAFVSNHEESCSLFGSDIFSIQPDGSDYRRITQAPACAELANYPKGVVHVPVRNLTFDTTVFFIYFQGAPGIQMITLGSGNSGTVTFENVADFGADSLQTAIAIGGAGRWLDAAASADVETDGEVTTPVLTISGQAIPEFGADWPAWQRDGDQLAYVLGFSSLYQIASHPQPLDLGSPLLQEDTQTSLFVNHLSWGPTPATANQILYDGGGDFDVPTGIYLTTAGSNSAGERLVSFETYDLVYGLAWLPDGSGFVYSVTEEFLSRSNVYVYRFATKKSTRLTDFSDRFAQILTLSPDGQQIVFEKAANEAEFGLSFTDYQLWIMDIDGGNLRLFVDNGRAPAWGSQISQLPKPAPLRLNLPNIEAR
jgi:hypothetical protein